MASIIERSNEVKQPTGGYLPLKKFEVTQLPKVEKLNKDENIDESIVELAVNYLTMFMISKDVFDAFRISLEGAYIAEDLKIIPRVRNTVVTLLAGIKGLSDESIINACKVVTFDIWYRDEKNAPKKYKSIDDINPDESTIKNIRVMVKRALEFVKKYGPVVAHGTSFETNGYSKTVDKGFGDFLTKNILWDLKVNKKNPTMKNTLALFMSYVMGKHSKQYIYKNLDYIGIYNPKLNKVYLCDLKIVSLFDIEAIEKEVICY